MKASRGFAYPDKELKNGVLKLMMLSYIRSHRTYPYEIMKVIKSLESVHGYGIFGNVSKNDIYNMTSSLEKGGYIKSRPTVKGSKINKVFAMTKKGNAVVRNKDRILLGMIKEMKRLVNEEFDD